MKATILHRFNKKAESYDTSAFFQTHIGERLAKKLPPSARTILEIGCGTGLFSERLVNLYPNAHFKLTDIAPNMVLQCQKRLGHYPTIQFDCLDGELLPEHEQYDLIVSNMSLHWFSEHRNSFQMILDRLIPGGHFVFSMLGMESLPEWHAIYKKYHYPIVTPHFPDAEKLKSYFPFMTIESESVTQQYHSAYDFIRSLKNIGATATAEQHAALSPGKLRKILRHFSDKLDISYEIIYGHYIKQ